MGTYGIYGTSIGTGIGTGIGAGLIMFVGGVTLHTLPSGLTGVGLEWSGTF